MLISKPLVVIAATCAILAPAQIAISSSDDAEFDEKAVCFHNCQKEYDGCEKACCHIDLHQPPMCPDRCLTECEEKFSFCRMVDCDIQATGSYFRDAPVVWWQEMCGFTCKWKKKNYKRKP